MEEKEELFTEETPDEIEPITHTSDASETVTDHDKIPATDDTTAEDTERDDVPVRTLDAEAADPARPPIQPTEEKPKRAYRTGTKIAAFIFFFITLAVFTIYEVFASEFLFKIFATKAESFGDAMGAIFGGIFGLIMTFIFGAAQLPENIISIILFGRIRGKSEKKWENVLFTVFFALSIVMLLAMILTLVLFFATVGSNNG